MPISSALVLLMLLSPLALAQGGGDRLTGRPFATRSPVLGTRGAVATSQPLATQAALDVLRRGGSAVDAAICANAVLGLVEPTGCGVGGDLFAIVWDPKKREVVGLNGSGRAPKALDLEGLKAELKGRDRIPRYGWLPVTVPGTVDAWCALHERYGKLPLAEVLAPAIAYAEEGFPLTQVIAYYWRRNALFLLRSEEVPEKKNFRATYTKDGRPPAEGDVWRNPDLAWTLRQVAKGGRDAFYEGEIAARIDAYARRTGGFLRREDLAAHRSEWVKPVSTTYRGHEVFELPPNGQGIAALQMLNILEGYDLAQLGHNSARYLHLHAEAKKLAFADRARFYADPAFAKIPVQGLISKAYAAERRGRISERAAPTVPAGEPWPHEGDTVYLCAADREGMMVSLIQSNYVGMGSGLVPDGCGFVLQDRGALFCLEPGHPNVYAPGKRPFHTIIPAFATRAGEPWLAFGVMGGSMQPQGHTQVLCNLIDFGMNVQEAGDAARYNHSGSSQPTGEVMEQGGVLALESGIGSEVRSALRERGHRVVRKRGGYGGYQAILFDAKRGVYHAASEMRKDGHAAAY